MRVNANAQGPGWVPPAKRVRAQPSPRTPTKGLPHVLLRPHRTHIRALPPLNTPSPRRRAASPTSPTPGPAALRARHDTKAGVWGLIRVLEGELKLTYLEPASEVILKPGHPGLIEPQQPHFVTPLGPMRMQVEFYHEPPPKS